MGGGGLDAHVVTYSVKVYSWDTRTENGRKTTGCIAATRRRGGEAQAGEVDPFPRVLTDSRTPDDH